MRVPCSRIANRHAVRQLARERTEAAGSSPRLRGGARAQRKDGPGTGPDSANLPSRASRSWSYAKAGDQQIPQQGDSADRQDHAGHNNGLAEQRVRAVAPPDQKDSKQSDAETEQEGSQPSRTRGRRCRHGPHTTATAAPMFSYLNNLTLAKRGSVGGGVWRAPALRFDEPEKRCSGISSW